ncbi:MAG: hypothetical protein PHN55_08825 [Dysgonamonadaceae bacterium]|nr:hypothetical protein [Dysgonamonadaceae bacterium]
MDYLKFVNAIIAQDNRNVINKVQRQITDIPKQILGFFCQYDPIDVEIVMKDLSAVVLYPYSYLHQLQSEYNFGKEYFIFATKNSDPIALFNGKVVTLAHGSRNLVFEIIADNFDEYIVRLIKNMKP